jgi:TPR repeat protein
MAATLVQSPRRAAAAEVYSTTAAPPLQPTARKEQPETTPASAPGPVSAVQMGTQPAAPAEMSTQQSKPQPTLLKPTAAPPAARNIADLVTRGDAFASSGDITSARLFYDRAVEEGDGRAALRMAMTFDPIVLSQIGIRATAGDSREALSWYQRARDLGQPIAKHLLDEINQQSRTANGSGQREGAGGRQD